jgi:hypothetical protein
LLSRQVIVGPETDPDEGPWYFSLNNRRLWVLKRCREEGLLENHLIFVRVRSAKSDAEAARYSLENCSLEARIMPEKRLVNSEGATKTELSQEKKDDNNCDRLRMVQDDSAESSGVPAKQQSTRENNDSSDEDADSSDDDRGGSSNRFSPLF